MKDGKLCINFESFHLEVTHFPLTFYWLKKVTWLCLNSNGVGKYILNMPREADSSKYLLSITIDSHYLTNNDYMD